MTSVTELLIIMFLPSYYRGGQMNFNWKSAYNNKSAMEVEL